MARERIDPTNATVRPVTFIASRNAGALFELTPRRSVRGCGPFVIPWHDDGPCVMGVDPGLSGGIVAVSMCGRRILCAYPMPTRPHPGRGRIKRRINGAALFEIFARSEILHVFVEDPGVVMGGSKPDKPAITSPLSIAALHATLGAIEAALSTHGIHHSRVYPAQWKKPFGLRGKRGKRPSVEVAAALWPQLENLRVMDNGQAEAALIARFGLQYTSWR